MNNSLKIPDNGLRLEGPSSQGSNVPQQAFAVSLNDNVIANMIKCFEAGREIKLSLGAAPTFHYGNKSHRLTPPPEPTPYDLYLTRPFESTKTAERVPHAGDLFTKPKGIDAPMAAKATKTAVSKAKAKAPSSSSGLDSDIEALRDGLAADAASKEQSLLVTGLLPMGKTSAKLKGKMFGTKRAVSTSPALVPVTSPSPHPASLLSATEQAMSKAKESRVVLVHELAVEDRTWEYLQGKWTGNDKDFKAVLSKVADCPPGLKKWGMRKAHWRELNVWEYDYNSQAERQKAIDNAIRQFDKQRLSASEPEWDRLLPKDERGKGKCLSRLQSELSKGPKTAPSAPKIKVQKADDSSTSKDDTDVGRNDKAKLGGESMVRSSSNPLPKGKSTTQPKKSLLANKPKVPGQSTSPAKAKAASGKSNGRMLSQAIIENSDSSGDEVTASNKPTPKAKPPPKPLSAPKPVVKLAEKGYVSSASKDPVKSVARRPRDEEESSSSSGTPLSRRLKQKTLAPGPIIRSETNGHRPPVRDPRDRGVSPAQKSKNTSPVKSSPLALSPPTNASDVSDNELRVPKKRKAEGENRAPNAKRKATGVDPEPKSGTVKRKNVDDLVANEVKAAPIRRKLNEQKPDGEHRLTSVKRKVELNGETREPPPKRKAAEIPADVMAKASRFRMEYEQYESLHHRLAGVKNPSQDQLDNLLDMRDRLQLMKQDIYKKYAAIKA